MTGYLSAMSIGCYGTAIRSGKRLRQQGAKIRPKYRNFPTPPQSRLDCCFRGKYLGSSFALNFFYPSSRGPNQGIRASASRLLGTKSTPIRLPSVEASLTECPWKLYRVLGIGAELPSGYRGSSCPAISHPSKAGVWLVSQASALRLYAKKVQTGRTKTQMLCVRSL
jgi:hypothetical protein